MITTYFKLFSPIIVKLMEGLNHECNMSTLKWVCPRMQCYAVFSLSVSVLIMATARWRNSCWQYSAEYSGKVSQTIPSENELGWRKAKTWVGRWGWRRMKTICAPRACCCHLWLIHSGQLSSQDSAAGVTFFTERERRSRSTVEHASNWRGALTATQTSKAIITFCYFKSQIFDIVDCTFPCHY